MAVERLKASTGNERTEFEALNDFDKAICDDLNSPKALTFLENVVTGKRYEQQRLQLATAMDAVLGLNLLTLNRADLRRSEEHTSELQSLMRISYAVFCLKKKSINNTISRTPYISTAS